MPHEPLLNVVLTMNRVNSKMAIKNSLNLESLKPLNRILCIIFWRTNWWISRSLYSMFFCCTRQSHFFYFRSLYDSIEPFLQLCFSKWTGDRL